MDVFEAMRLALAAGLFVAIFYWVVVRPQRLRRERRKALGTPGQFASGAWDPRIWSGPRNRNS